MACPHCSSADDETLVRLVYELLDAHEDTARLMRDETDAGGSVAWRAHLDYLQRLQRVGREVLAGALAHRAPTW
jgi:hypothetical protein